jgi:hypothetical protein
VRELIGEIRAHLGRALTLEFRMDAVFFQQHLLKLRETSLSTILTNGGVTPLPQDTTLALLDVARSPGGVGGDARW